jgi:predicted nuclease with TOPRIM domain
LDLKGFREVMNMAFFDSMKETLTTAGRDVSQKAKEVSGVAKLKLDIKSKEDALNKEYIALGKRYYDMQKEGEIADEQIANVSSLLSEIADLKDEVVRMQGGACCPHCGAVIPEGAAFCSKCGAKM